VRLEHLGEQARGRERLVQLVRDARDEPTERRELLGLLELLARAARLAPELRGPDRDGHVVREGGEQRGVERPALGQLAVREAIRADQLVLGPERDDDRVAYDVLAADLVGDDRRGLHAEDDQWV